LLECSTSTIRVPAMRVCPDVKGCVYQLHSHLSRLMLTPRGTLRYNLGQSGSWIDTLLIIANLVV